jgi:NitT/TauT family transport system substrate-binding protein
MRKRAWLACALITWLPACQKWRDAGHPPFQKITINIPSNPAAALVTIAQRNNRFREQGLDVDVVMYATGKIALDRMGAGEAQFAVAAETPLATSILQNDPVRMIAAIGSLDRSTAVLARADHGIRRPRDLAGKTIGVSKGTSAEYLCFLFLSANGMEMSDVNIKNLSPEKATEEFIAGRLDAACLWHPYLERAGAALGDKSISFESDVAYMWTLLLVGRQDFLAKNPLLVRAVVRALLAAQQDYDAADDHTLRAITEAHQVDLAWIAANAKNIRLAVTLNQAVVSVLDDNLQWATRRRRAPGKLPNPLDFIYWDALRSEKPETITIIRPQ